MWKRPIILVVCLAGAAYIFLPPFSTMQDKRTRNAEYQTQIDDLKQKQKDLLLEKKLLEEDPFYLEKIAREKMGLVKEGEVVVRMKPLKKLSSEEY